MQHLDEGTIHAWLDGALDAAESSRVERHVAECETCSEAVAEARGMIAGASRIVSALDVVPGNVIPLSPRQTPARGWLWRSLRLTPGRAALAATLLLAIGTMLTVQHAPNDGLVKAPVTPAATPAAAAQEAVVPKPTTQAQSAAVAPSIAMRDAKPQLANKPAKRIDTVVAPQADARALAATANGFAAPAAAPAPNDTASAKQAAKAKPITALSEVVTTSTGVLRKVDSTSTDTLNRSRANALDSAQPAAVDAARARQLSVVQRAGRGPAFAGAVLRAPECYRVNSDSATIGQGGAFLPRQFSLQQTAGSPPQNVVRAVAPDGRLDSAIAGARWEQITPTTTTLYLTRSTGASTPTLTLSFADGRIAGQLSTPAGPRNVDIVRWPCRP